MKAFLFLGSPRPPATHRISCFPSIRIRVCETSPGHVSYSAVTTLRPDQELFFTRSRGCMWSVTETWSGRGPKGVGMVSEFKMTAPALGCLGFPITDNQLRSSLASVTGVKCPFLKMKLPSLFPCVTNPNTGMFWTCSCPQLLGIMMDGNYVPFYVYLSIYHTDIQPWEGKLWSGWLTTDTTVLFLAGCPQSWLSMCSRVWETGKQFVWFGHLRPASLLPLEVAVK